MNKPDSFIHVNRDLLRWISLGIGILALLVAVISFVVIPASGDRLVAYISLGLGVLGLAGYVALDPVSFTEAITGRTGQYRLTSALLSLFVLAFIIVLYVVLREAAIEPIDVTQEQEFKLSEESIAILQGLDEPVHAYAFFTDQSFQREDAIIWLDQYVRESDGLFTYDLVDPDRNPSLARNYDVTREGVTIFVQDERNASAGTPDERQYAAAIARVLQGGERILYATTGHGERDLDDFTAPNFADIKRQLTNSNYLVSGINLLAEGGVPADANALLIGGPTAQFTAVEVGYIADYLDSGGAVFLLSDPGTGGGGLSNGVLGITYSSDGATILTAGADGTARIWDAESGEELVILHGHTSDVLDIAFSPDASQVLTAGADGSIRVFDVSSGTEIARLEGQTDLVRRLAYSPDGRTIASAGEDQVLNVWDAATFEPMTYSPLVAPIPLMTLDFSPDGSLVAAAGGRNDSSSSVYAWDVASGQPVVQETLHNNTVLSIAFSPDGSTLTSTSIDGTVGTLNLADGSGTTTPLYPDNGITAFAIAPDGTQAFALVDGTLHLHTPGSGIEDDTVIAAHQDVVWDIAFSADGAALASASRDGEIKVWDSVSGAEELSLSGHTGIDPLLTYLEQNWAIRVRDDLVVDLLGPAEGFDELTAVVYGSNLDIQSTITRPIIDSGRRVFLPLARSIEVVQLEGSPVVAQPLMTSSSSLNQIISWGETTNPFASGGIELDESDTPGPLVLAVSAENFNTGGRLVVIGDADFVSNSAITSATFANADLFVNAANWLTEGEDAIQLPPANFNIRQFDTPLSLIERGLAIIGITCLIPLGALATGGIMWFRRRRRR